MLDYYVLVLFQYENILIVGDLSYILEELFFYISLESLVYFKMTVFSFFFFIANFLSPFLEQFWICWGKNILTFIFMDF
jgi:hypothetical protein